MTAADSSSHCIVPQEVLPHQPEAVAVQGQAVQSTEVGPEIGLDEIAASLRLEHGPVAAALLKARDALQKQQQAQQQRQREEAAAATAQSHAAAQKPKVSRDCILLLAVQMSQAVSFGETVVAGALGVQCQAIVAPVKTSLFLCGAGQHHTLLRTTSQGGLMQGHSL